ncbi:UDP-N-acetylglucosamine 1-carboxyvinyltransferase [Candidatus Wolfebacteria bacterium RIFOXYD12_FULL_48_21]|uniref:UDP-N-acetylglucosamine 1-carboxyvinyltransferase n=1 Tax=Candidatus Wolfebacteria bacterium RIFOXYD1_FULL_48_65 TaxID=1802561 RepID=A0A1F8E2Q1_9BACT|nr:MAG: UDP-N-acetylglucosamine 1-carboxyvinyltransferase [Candidatus Wolfebacteria bacterium RIFOXYD1_FULL_48_65]OGM94428.1 MAG: UDP-N-acetylglucosamine 1-carboxyvinyltransferase [Candidatus Wolfebacteria bacterium RIFOXYD12_FULL_48_21]
MRFIINGGKPLRGAIEVKGSKNATTKMMIASLLTDEECVLENFPSIGDTEITKELCEHIGATVTVDGSTARLCTPNIKSHRVTQLTRRNRIPILALGPLLNRVGKAEVPVLGGDKIGARPVDIHLDGLKQLGAEITHDDKFFYASAPNGLTGATITLRYPSVGATENIILASVLAKGRTVIHNAAVEPEIMDIILLLQKMGAIIGLGSDRTIYIEGVKKLHGARHRILPDRNEAVSFACLGLAFPGNEVTVKNAVQKDLITFLNAVRKIGGEYRIEDDGITFFRKDGLVASEVETDTHPGFMTDWQQPFLILLTQAAGTSVMHETVYEDRFGYTEELKAMGANIAVFSKCLGELSCRYNGQGFPHSAIVSGPTPLRGVDTLKVRDLRAGMAHMIAALVAEGESVIEGIEEIDRGYEVLDTRLRALGADIRRVD